MGPLIFTKNSALLQESPLIDEVYINQFFVIFNIQYSIRVKNLIYIEQALCWSVNSNQ